MGSAMASRVAEFESGGMPMTPEAFRVAMLQTFETLPLDKVAKLLTVPMATAHAAAAAGVEGSVTA
jgi:hypothetical protein